MELKKLIEEIRKINDLNGWIYPDNAWEDNYYIPAKIMLFVTELSEAVEAFRKNDKENFAEELADIFIYTVLIARHFEIVLEEAILEKIKVVRARRT